MTAVGHLKFLTFNNFLLLYRYSGRILHLRTIFTQIGLSFTELWPKAIFSNASVLHVGSENLNFRKLFVIIEIRNRIIFQYRHI